MKCLEILKVSVTNYVTILLAAQQQPLLYYICCVFLFYMLLYIKNIKIIYIAILDYCYIIKRKEKFFLINFPQSFSSSSSSETNHVIDELNNNVYAVIHV